MRGGGHGGQAGKWRQGERREGRLLHAGWWAVHRRVNGVSRPPASDRRGVNEQCTLIGAAILQSGINHSKPCSAFSIQTYGPNGWLDMMRGDARQRGNLYRG